MEDDSSRAAHGLLDLTLIAGGGDQATWTLAGHETSGVEVVYSYIVCSYRQHQGNIDPFHTAYVSKP